MDLFSAARRLARPFEVGPDAQGQSWSIGAHGLIGDGLTAALIRPDGAIDWLCMPRFDSPSVFGALLDEERGGKTRVGPSALHYQSLQRYDPDTNVLETLFTVPGQGVIRLIDYMPWSNDPRATIHEVHRRVECIEGKVGVEVHFDPRFGYGTGAAELDVSRHGVLARGPDGERLVAALQGNATWQGDPRGGVAARFELAVGQRRWMVLSWDAEAPEPVSAYRPFEHLRNTRHSWRAWSNRLKYDGPWRHHVLRSALCLKLLIHAPTGAMVAAPTTSLPEWLGGSRNWDYRYAWARDSAMAIRACNLLGYSDEARDFFHFLRDTLDQDLGLQVMYTVDGKPVPDELELAHLCGFANSVPVRAGNGARDQLQLDTAGAVVDAAHLYERFGGTLSLRIWRKLSSIVERTRSNWQEPDHGIWEPRSGVRHNVHSRAMCWLALDRGAGMASLFGADALHSAWTGVAHDIKSDILQSGLDPTGKHFVAAYGSSTTDAALLNLPLLGMLPDDHPLMLETVSRIRQELGHGPFVYRYKGEDGVGGDEGAFVLCGFWLAEALALQGNLEEAQEVFVAHSESSNHLGLLAEEIDPTDRSPLGNFPQAFSHLGLINAAFRIDLALRLRDEGSRSSPHFVDPPARR